MGSSKNLDCLIRNFIKFTKLEGQNIFRLYILVGFLINWYYLICYSMLQFLYNVQLYTTQILVFVLKQVNEYQLKFTTSSTTILTLKNE